MPKATIHDISSKMNKAGIAGYVPENPVLRPLIGAANDDHHKQRAEGFIKHAYFLDPPRDKSALYKGTAVAVGFGMFLAEAWGDSLKERFPIKPSKTPTYQYSRPDAPDYKYKRG